MYTERRCPLCNQVMIGEMDKKGVIYLCPIHSFTEPLKESKGVHMHITEPKRIKSRVWKSLDM